MSHAIGVVLERFGTTGSPRKRYAALGRAVAFAVALVLVA